MTCIGLAVLGAVTVYQARPYLKVAQRVPDGAKRTLKEVETYSSGPAALLSASSGEPRVGLVTARDARETCTPRTRTCSSPAG